MHFTSYSMYVSIHLLPLYLYICFPYIYTSVAPISTHLLPLYLYICCPLSIHLLPLYLYICCPYIYTPVAPRSIHLLPLYLYICCPYIYTSVAPISIHLLPLYLYICCPYIYTSVTPISTHLLPLYLHICYPYIYTSVDPISIHLLPLYLYICCPYIYTSVDPISIICWLYILYTLIHCFLGRGISALPLLSTAGSTKPHPLVTPSSAEERGGAGHVTSKVDEPQDYASNTATSKNCPDDALYPAKRGPATLFLGDCLNVKNKDLPDTAGII